MLLHAFCPTEMLAFSGRKKKDFWVPLSPEICCSFWQCHVLASLCKIHKCLLNSCHIPQNSCYFPPEPGAAAAGSYGRACLAAFCKRGCQSVRSCDTGSPPPWVHRGAPASETGAGRAACQGASWWSWRTPEFETRWVRRTYTSR